ncbi:MAG TPA: hypothetical protein VEO74_11630 [Thermoanaerobaculia bacterium]|nr:hypothetical protein [Thermoanaerobaculia bacterium]
MRLASGVRFDATELLRAGSEFQYDFRSRSGAVIPQLWFAFPHEVTIKAGYASGFRGTPHFFRAAVEFEF